MEKITDKKCILITGAYGGMGWETVKALSQNGFSVFALDRKIGEHAENIVPVEADITDEESVKRAFSLVAERTESLYAIVHFAGVYMLNSLLEMDEKTFRRIFEINLFGAATINRIFFPLLKKKSRIIMTTSELAPLAPLPFTGIYAVTKTALDRYAYSLRMEMQLLNIDVSVLRAGAVRTDMLGVSTDALDRFCENTALYSCNAERFKRIVNGVEAKNVPPQKIARKVCKILSRKHPRFAYAVNRNPLLLLLNILPARLQFFIIRQILK